MAKSNSLNFFNFAGGLNTEATPLNIAPTDMIVADNVKLNRDGSIERRGAIDFLGAAGDEHYVQLSEFYDVQAGTTDTYPVWDAPATMFVGNFVVNNIVRKYMFAQFGKYVYIYDYTSASNLVDIANPLQIVDLNTGAEFYKCRFDQNKNRVFIFNQIEPVSYVQLETDGTFSLNKLEIYFRILDHPPTSVIAAEETRREAVLTETGDRLRITFEEVTDTYTYSLTGDALVTPDASSATIPRTFYICIREHTAAADNEPGTGDNWELYWRIWGRLLYDEGTDYDWAADSVYKTNVTPLNTEANSFAGGVFAQGRLWLYGNVDHQNTVYFSQIVDQDDKVGVFGYMYQKADPFSSEPFADTDIVATDGGTITLAGANTIFNVIEYRDGVLIFADSGVWYATGVAGFTPDDFKIKKVIDTGASGKDAITAVEDTVFYFSSGDGYVITVGTDPDDIKAEPITNKIKTFYENISLDVKSRALAKYNKFTKKLFYFYNETEHQWVIENDKKAQGTHYRNVLVFDVLLQAWYKYKLTDDEEGTAVSILALEPIEVSSSFQTANVIEENSDQVINENADDIIARSAPIEKTISNMLMVGKPNEANQTYDIGFALLDSTVSQDFESSSVDVVAFDTTVKMAFGHFGDILRNKSTPYAMFVFRRLEQGELDAETGIDINRGKCKLRVNYNWATGSVSPKYGTFRSIYFPDKYTASPLGGADAENSVVTYKSKIRGFGKSVQFELANDGDFPFHLYGWELIAKGYARE